MKRRPLFHSLIWKLFSGVLMCIVLLIAFNWLLNSFVLPSYYRHTKQNSLYNAFSDIDTLYQQADAYIVEEKLQLLRNNENIGTLIWQGNRVLLDYRATGGRPVERVPRLEGLISGEYYVQTDSDPILNTEVLTLYGVLHNGYHIQIRISLSAIEESVGITNRFLLISGLVTLLFSVGLILLVARSFTIPIRTLSRVANSVANLDFHDQYDGSGSGELDDLGNSINAMSAALADTISSLQEANEQLAEDNAFITKQNEARKAFISNVSHELKTPIALMQTYAEALRENVAEDTEARRYYCEVIEDEAAKMTEMIRRMTMLMQLEGGEQLEPELFDITELVRNLLIKNRPRFADKQVTVEFPEETPVWVNADGFLIENVLTNYISNAFNHVSTAGRIRADIQPSEEERIRVSLYNTGNHIPAEDLPRIWESFYKVDKARTRAYGGTGIGLSVVAAIMRAHRTPYGVRNCKDGVEFFFDLPLAEINN